MSEHKLFLVTLWWVCVFSFHSFSYFAHFFFALWMNCGQWMKCVVTRRLPARSASMEKTKCVRRRRMRRRRGRGEVKKERWLCSKLHLLLPVLIRKVLLVWPRRRTVQLSIQAGRMLCMLLCDYEWECQCVRECQAFTSIVHAWVKYSVKREEKRSWMIAFPLSSSRGVFELLTSLM